MKSENSGQTDIFVVSFAVILFHLLPFVVTRCTSRCHSLSLGVPLVCHFINNPFSSVLSSSKVYQILFVHSFLMGCHQKQQMFWRSFSDVNNHDNTMRIISKRFDIILMRINEKSLEKLYDYFYLRLFSYEYT